MERLAPRINPGAKKTVLLRVRRSISWFYILIKIELDREKYNADAEAFHSEAPAFVIVTNGCRVVNTEGVVVNPLAWKIDHQLELEQLAAPHSNYHGENDHYQPEDKKQC